MRQTLCYIPETCYGIPVFGWGWGLAMLVAAVILVHACQYIKHRKIDGLGDSLGLLVLGGIILVFILPTITQPGVGTPIRGYGFCLLLAIFAAFFLVLHLAKKQNISGEKVISLCFWTVIAGIVGARLFYVTEYWQKMLRFDEAGQILPIESLFSLFNIADGGIVVFGSILGGMLAALVFMLLNKMPILRTFDLMAPALMLGIAIGRIGCLLNGCCFGAVTESSWGIVFPPDSPAHFHQVAKGMVAESSLLVLPVYPTQIISSGLALLLCVTLLILRKSRLFRERDGLVFATFMILYSMGRFMIEFVRNDEDSFFGTGLTVSQNVCTIFGLAGVALLVYLYRNRASLSCSSS